MIHFIIKWEILQGHVSPQELLYSHSNLFRILNFVNSGLARKNNKTTFPKTSSHHVLLRSLIFNNSLHNGSYRNYRNF